MLVVSSLGSEFMYDVGIHFACCLKHWVLCTEIDELKTRLSFIPVFSLSSLFRLLAVYPRNVAATDNMDRSSAGRSQKESQEGKLEAAVS